MVEAGEKIIFVGMNKVNKTNSVFVDYLEQFNGFRVIRASIEKKHTPLITQGKKTHVPYHTV